ACRTLRRDDGFRKGTVLAHPGQSECVLRSRRPVPELELVLERATEVQAGYVLQPLQSLPKDRAGAKLPRTPVRVVDRAHGKMLGRLALVEWKAEPRVGVG